MMFIYAIVSYSLPSHQDTIKVGAATDKVVPHFWGSPEVTWERVDVKAVPQPHETLKRKTLNTREILLRNR